MGTDGPSRDVNGLEIGNAPKHIGAGEYVVVAAPKHIGTGEYVVELN